MSRRRALQSVLILGAAAGVASFVYFGFLTNAIVADTNCYAVLWQRNGRAICDSSNLRREVFLALSVALAAGSGVGLWSTGRQGSRVNRRHTGPRSMPS